MMLLQAHCASDRNPHSVESPSTLTSRIRSEPALGRTLWYQNLSLSYPNRAGFREAIRSDRMRDVTAVEWRHFLDAKPFRHRRRHAKRGVYLYMASYPEIFGVLLRCHLPGTSGEGSSKSTCTAFSGRSRSSIVLRLCPRYTTPCACASLHTPPAPAFSDKSAENSCTCTPSSWRNTSSTVNSESVDRDGCEAAAVAMPVFPLYAISRSHSIATTPAHTVLSCINRPAHGDCWQSNYLL